MYSGRGPAIATWCFTALVLMTLCALRGTAQNKQQMKQQFNPLLCDPATGICELPESSTDKGIQPGATGPKPVKIIYFTDPICSSCWGIEPQLRKLKLEYGASVTLEYHMGGLLPDWSYNSGGISKPSDVAHHWDEVSRHYQMPIDGDIWLEDPLHSSYPPSIAFKAAQLQDEHKAVVFLRRIREMVFLEKKNITKWEYLVEAATGSGIDTVQFSAQFAHEAEAAFREDLKLARQSGVRGFPTLLVTGAKKHTETLYGFVPYERFEQAVQNVYPGIEKTPYDTSLEQLFEYYPTLTTNEYATLSNNTLAESETILQQATHEGKITCMPGKNGPIWKRKSNNP